MRKMWMRANEWSDKRVASMNVLGEGKVCWICRIREVDPDWRPGMPIPKLPGHTKFNLKGHPYDSWGRNGQENG